MKDIEKKILLIFKNNASKEFSTSQLTKKIFIEEWLKIENLKSSSSKEKIKEAKRIKFKLHRKLIYYLNKLVKNKILKVVKIEEKGEKVFCLDSEEGSDLLIKKGYEKITISKPVFLPNYIEKYEINKEIKKFNEESFINKLNAILIECENKNLDQLLFILKEVGWCINDVIALNRFEKIINETATNEKICLFLDNINKYLNEQDLTLSIIIDSLNIDQLKAKNFIDCFSSIENLKINLIIETKTQDILKKSNFFYHLISKFSEKKIKINIKNKNLALVPFFKGKAGIYNFEEEEWNNYCKNIKGKTIGVSCSQSSLGINMFKILENKTPSEFRQALINATKLLFYANDIQRKNSKEYFKNINSLNKNNENYFYSISRNYIRLWNYNWEDFLKNENNVFDLIKSSKELIENFCHNEETIFKSCGMPIRFRVVMGSAFSKFNKEFESERDYRKIDVSKSEDLYYKLKEFIMIREKIFEIFEGGDRLRIFRIGNFKIEDIINELNFILNSYRVPFFAYDFNSTKNTIKLTDFIN